MEVVECLQQRPLHAGCKTNEQCEKNAKRLDVRRHKFETETRENQFTFSSFDRALWEVLGAPPHRRVEAVTRPILDVFSEVDGTVGGAFTGAGATSEKTEQHLND